MTSVDPTRPVPRLGRRRVRAVPVLLVVVTLGVATGCGTSTPSSVDPTSTAGAVRGIPHGAGPIALGPPRGALPPRATEQDSGSALGEADGSLPGGTTVFDDAVPGVANLDPALLAALRRAATDARADRVTFIVDSGWRSRAYQQSLLDRAVAEYGSEEEAARWVATPDTSLHVQGRAVDLGSAAAAWLSAHGAAYGLCQIYRNERWHYELRPEATSTGCPAMYADPSRDPRLQP